MGMSPMCAAARVRNGRCQHERQHHRLERAHVVREIHDGAVVVLAVVPAVHDHVRAVFLGLLERGEAVVRPLVRIKPPERLAYGALRKDAEHAPCEAKRGHPALFARNRRLSVGRGAVPARPKQLLAKHLQRRMLHRFHQNQSWTSCCCGAASAAWRAASASARCFSFSSRWRRSSSCICISCASCALRSSAACSRSRFACSAA